MNEGESSGWVSVYWLAVALKSPQGPNHPSVHGSRAETGVARSLLAALDVTICHRSSKIRVGKGLNIVDVILFWIWWLC